MCQYKPSVKETFYKNIFLLEPSKYLLFKDGFLRSSHYKHYKEYGFQGKDLTDAKKALRQRLTEACKVKKMRVSPFNLAEDWIQQSFIK